MFNCYNIHNTKLAVKCFDYLNNAEEVNALLLNNVRISLKYYY